MFERYVNSKDNQTEYHIVIADDVFERYVNSKDNQTEYHIVIADDVFERYVNSKDNQTLISPPRSRSSLRDM